MNGNQCNQRSQNHCWHDVGRDMFSTPPKIKLQCCFCGLEKIVVFNRRHLETIEREKHGSYVSEERVVE